MKVTMKNVEYRDVDAMMDCIEMQMKWNEASITGDTEGDEHSQPKFIYTGEAGSSVASDIRKIAEKLGWKITVVADAENKNNQEGDHYYYITVKGRIIQG